MEDDVEIGAGVTPEDVSRKLATVRTIAELAPIEGADKIEAARVDGWWCVVSKGEFNVGDPCVYFEIDSFIPIGEKHPHFEFLRKRAVKWNGKEGCRLRTIRLKGQVSQGLAMPLSSFKFDFELKLGGEVSTLHLDFSELNSRGVFTYNNDVTDLLGVEKWEAILPAQLAGKAIGNFPSFLRKTDQERVQNMGRELARLRENNPDTEFEITTKLDGTSMTAYLTQDRVFGVCSRNLDLVRDENNSYWKFAIENNVEARMNAMADDFGIAFKGLALQGELMGPGIQGNQEQLTELKWFIFDVWTIGGDHLDGYYKPNDRRRICSVYGFDHVPYINTIPLKRFVTNQHFMDCAIGTSLNPTVMREGVVFRDIDNPNLSFKAISAEWLLKNE